MAAQQTFDMHVRIARHFIRQLRIGKSDVWMWKNGQWVLNLYGMNNILTGNGFESYTTDAQLGQIIGDFTMQYCDNNDPQPFDCVSDPDFGKYGAPRAYSAMQDMAVFCVIHTVKELIPPPKRPGRSA